MSSARVSYIATQEDFLFLQQLFEKNGSPLYGMLTMFKFWHSDSKPIKIYKKDVSVDSVTALIKNKFDHPPKLNLYDDGFWSMIYHRDKHFILELHKYLKPKGFDIMKRILQFIENDKGHYKSWCVLPNYIYCLNKLGEDHTVDSELLFKTINWLSKIKKKYACNASISLLYYLIKHPNICDSKKIIDIFTDFTNSQKSIPKSEIKRYEALLLSLEKLDKNYWDSTVKKNPEIRNRLNKKDSSHYEVQDGISRKWIFDAHHLSSKNGNFNVRFMKDNFERFYFFIPKSMSEAPEVYQLDYQQNDAIITINILAENSPTGKEYIEKLQKMIDLIYNYCLKSHNLGFDEVQQLLNKLILTDSLEKSLTTKEKKLTKIAKI